MARNQHTWAPKYSQAEKEAVIRASLVDGISYRVIAIKAAAGELPGAGKFKIDPSYIGKVVRLAKLKVNPEDLTTPESQARAIEKARNGALALILREMERWQQRAKAGEMDLAQHARLMRALAEHEKTARTRPGHDQPESPDPQAQGTQDALAQLLEAVSNGTKQHSDKGTNPVSLAHAGSEPNGAASA